jgi:molecular chaperone DnaK (HSP70)
MPGFTVMKQIGGGILSVGDTVSVTDIGGRTTDFSLISVEEKDGNLHLKR